MEYIIVSDTSEINGGGAKVAIETASGLADSGERVIFFAGGGSIDKKLLHDNIRVINLGMDNLLSGGKIKMFFTGYYNKKAKKEFEKLLNEIDLNNTVIHVHSWVKSLSTSIFVPLAKRKKHIYITANDYFLLCPNGGFFIYPKNVICDNKRNLKCLFCNCDSRNYIFKIWRYFRYKKQTRILNKCNYSIFSLSSLMKATFQRGKMYSVIINNPIDMNKGSIETIDKKPSSFIYIGRLSKEKGVELMCEAFAKTGLSCRIFGDGPIKEELVNKYGSFKNISFMGWKSIDEIKHWFKDSIALVFPSLWYEGAPLVIPEVQSYGVPAIVSDACAGVDYIKEMESGLTFKSSDLNDLVDKLSILNNLSDDKYLALRKSTADFAISNNHLLEQYICELKKNLILR